MKKNYLIRVYGRVQGVSFRYYAMQMAHIHGVTGFARNNPDGSVSIEAEGEEAAIGKFREWCREGPSWAHVERMEVQEGEVKGHERFIIK